MHGFAPRPSSLGTSKPIFTYRPQEGKVASTVWKEVLVQNALHWGSHRCLRGGAIPFPLMSHSILFMTPTFYLGIQMAHESPPILLWVPRGIVGDGNGMPVWEVLQIYERKG